MEAAQKRKLARGPLGARLLRALAAAWAWAGISAPRVAPSWAKSGPTGAVRSWPLDQIGRLSMFLAGTKPAGAVSPPNPKSFLFLPFLSPFGSGGAAGVLPPRWPAAAMTGSAAVPWGRHDRASPSSVFTFSPPLSVSLQRLSEQSSTGKEVVPPAALAVACMRARRRRVSDR